MAVIFNMHRQSLFVLLFFYFAILQSGQPSQEVMENLKQVIYETSVYKDRQQSFFSVADYIKISVELSEAMTHAGCKENCCMTCLGVSYTCLASCYPLLAAKMRCEYTMSIAQNYLKEHYQERVNPFVFKPIAHRPCDNQNNGYGYYYNPYEDDGML